MFKKAINITLCITGMLGGNAQPVSSSLGSGPGTEIRSDGLLFTNGSGTSTYNFPAGTGLPMIRFAGFWISARSNSGLLMQSVTTNPAKPEFWSGPIDTITRKSKNPELWNKIYHANAGENNYHRKHFSDAGYVIPSSISQWPAHSSQGDALPAVLAPFIDWNNDGTYNPQFGDYPAIVGDESILCLYNDEYGEHATGGTAPLKAQILQQGFNTLESGLDHVTWLNAYIKNMNDVDWNDCYIALYADLILGNETDNYAGTDANKNLVFGYNADGFDEGFYGSNLPYTALMPLNHSLFASMIFNEAAENKLPVDAGGYENVMHGKLPSGAIKYESSGATRFSYPGVSDLVHTKIERSEESDTTVAGARKILAIVGPFNLKSNEFVKLDFAIFSDTSSQPLVALRNKANTVNAFYNQYLSAKKIKNNPDDINIYPNPAGKTEQIKINHLGNRGAEIKIFGPLGQLQYQMQTVENEVIIPEGVFNDKGLFIIAINREVGSVYKKIIIN